MRNGHPTQTDDQGRSELVDRLLDLARESGMEVTEDSDLGEVLERLSAGTEIPARAVLVMGEILGYVFRFDRELALSVERERDRQRPDPLPVADRDKIGD